MPLYLQRSIRANSRAYRSLIAAVAATGLATVAEASSWKAAVSGDWGDSTQWSDGQVPTTQPTTQPTTTISATGAAYTVTMAAAQGTDALVLDSEDATLESLGRLTVTQSFAYLKGTVKGFVTFAGASLDPATLLFAGQTVASGAFLFHKPGQIRGTSGAASSSVPAGVTVIMWPNYTLSVQSGAANYGSIGLVGDRSRLYIDGPAGTYTNYGALTFQGTSTSFQRIVESNSFNGWPHLVNAATGTVTVQAHTRFDTLYDNHGVTNISTGQTLIATGFTMSGGALNISGKLIQNAPFYYNGGSINGTVSFSEWGGSGAPRQLYLGTGTLSAATFQFDNAGEIFGTIRPGMTVFSNRNAGQELIVQAGDRNDGVLSLEGSGFSSVMSLLIRGSGTYTNAGALTFNDLATSLLQQRIAPLLGTTTFVNTGTINMNARTQLEMGLINSGDIAIPFGKHLNVLGDATISGGTLSLGGSLSMNNLTYTGGAITGTVSPSSLTMGSQTVGSGTFQFTNSAKVNGNILSGMTALLRPNSGAALLTVTSGGFNNGTITLENRANSSPTNLTLRLQGPGPYTNNGTINFNEGALSAGARFISSDSNSAWLLNNGTFNMNASTSVMVNFANHGTLNVAANKSATFLGLSISGGTMNLTDPVQAAHVLYTGGTVNGTVSLSAPLLNSTLSFGSQTVGSGTFMILNGGSVRGVSTSQTTIPTGVTVNLRSVQLGTLSIAAGGANSGRLILDSPGVTTSTSTLAISGSGIYTNNGRIDLEAGPGPGAYARNVTGTGVSFVNGANGVVNFNGSPAVSLSSTFQPSVENHGTFKNNAANVTFQQPFTNHGTYVSDPAVNNFAALIVEPTGSLSASTGDVFNITGDFTNRSTTHWQVGGATLAFTTAAAHTVTIDGQGKVQWGTIEIDAADQILFQDGDGGAGGGLYATNLVLPTQAGAPDLSDLSFDGVTLYFDPAALSNLYLNTWYNGLTSEQQSTSSIQPGLAPEPSTLSLIALAGAGLLARRRRLVG